MSTKPKQQPEPTAAERYEAAKEKQFEEWLESSFSRQALKGVELFEHKVPSGITFKVRNLSAEFLAQSGAVPMGSISSAVLSKEPGEPSKELTPEEQQAEFEALSPGERASRIVQINRQILYICVEPRLIDGPVNGHKNAVSTSQLTLADWNSLAMRSNPMRGAASSGLRTFRSKRR